MKSICLSVVFGVFLTFSGSAFASFYQSTFSVSGIQGKVVGDKIETTNLHEVLVSITVSGNGYCVIGFAGASHSCEISDKSYVSRIEENIDISPALMELFLNRILRDENLPTNRTIIGADRYRIYSRLRWWEDHPFHKDALRSKKTKFEVYTDDPTEFFQIQIEFEDFEPL